MKCNVVSAVVVILLSEVLQSVLGRQVAVIKEKELESRLTTRAYLYSQFAIFLLLTGLYRLWYRCIIEPVFCHPSSFIRDLDQKLAVFYG